MYDFLNILLNFKQEFKFREQCWKTNYPQKRKKKKKTAADKSEG